MLPAAVQAPLCCTFSDAVSVVFRNRSGPLIYSFPAESAYSHGVLVLFLLLETNSMATSRFVPELSSYCFIAYSRVDLLLQTKKDRYALSTVSLLFYSESALSGRLGRQIISP